MFLRNWIPLLAAALAAPSAGATDALQTFPLTSVEEINAVRIDDLPVATKELSKTRARELTIPLHANTLKPRANPFFYTAGWPGLSTYTRFGHAARLEMYTYGKPPGILLEDLAAHLRKNGSKLSGKIATATSESVGLLSVGPVNSDQRVPFCARYQTETATFAPDAKLLPKRLGQAQSAPFRSVSIQILDRLPGKDCTRR